jgi:outer membrane protein assembly factor BamD (BamD/ComL family)
MITRLVLATGARLRAREVVRRLPQLLLAGAWLAAAGGCQSVFSPRPLPEPSGARAAAEDAPEDKGGKKFSLVSFQTWDLFAPPKTPPPPVESFVLRADGLVEEKVPEAGTPDARLAGARELFRRGEYAKAEAAYHYVGDNPKNPMPAIVEAKYYEAECLRLQGHWPKAADSYNDLLSKYPQNPYREQALQRLFDIANFWLDDTREVMRENREVLDKKRWFVWPHWFHTDRRKPFFEEETRAIEALEQVRFNDINGPLADKALFMAGSVKFYNEDYREAQLYFDQIHEKHPNSPLAEDAIKLAIISKSLSTGGPEYDGREVAKARILIDAAFRSYPKLAQQEEDFLVKQLKAVNLQQAEKDFLMAQFWEKTGHPGSAYFYYELVKRRYPGTKPAEEAAARVEKLEREKKLSPAQNGPPLQPQPPADPTAAQPTGEPRQLPAGLKP